MAAEDIRRADDRAPTIVVIGAVVFRSQNTAPTGAGCYAIGTATSFGTDHAVRRRGRIPTLLGGCFFRAANDK
jgi:hypothetical protein